jgi:proliferating cell nuclear antigen
MKFFLKTVTPKVITSCLEVLKDILQDVNVFIRPSGIKILVYDVARVALIDLFLPSENFEEYTCTGDIIAGISISNTYKILKSITTTDTLEMSMTESDHLTINIYNTDKKSHTHFLLKLLEIDEEIIGQPELPIKCITTISATEFQKICRDMSNLSSNSNVTINIIR